MDNPYAKIFQHRGALKFSAAGFVARLPVAMAPIGIVAMLSRTNGEYWLAGSVAAVFGLANALLAPQISRLVDRFGQRRVVGPTTILAGMGFFALILGARWAWPAWTMIAAALLAATMPSISAMVRARWSALLGHRPELNTAFAFEAAADELIYILGASMSVGLTVSLFPEAGVLAALLLLATGTLALLLQRATEPRVAMDVDRTHGPSAIRLRPVQIVTVAMIFVGTIFATAEVGAVAITEALGKPEGASLVVGVYAAGSFVLGIALGAVNPKLPLHRQLLIALTLLALTTTPLLFATGSVAALAVATCVSGLAVSPTFITAFGLIEARVPASSITEGVTWVTTGIGLGMAFGSFAAGWMVDTHGPRASYWISIGASWAAVLAVAVSQRSLASGPTAATEGPRCDA